jgi:tripartite-type tricarboxylate transporter receptor subunit TctC
MKKITLAFALAAMAAAFNVQAQYPDKPVRMLVPYPPGGTADLLGRLAAQKLTDAWGKSVVIENRGGAGGLTATEAYFKAEQDGHTLVVGAIGPLTIIPALKPVPYDVEKDVVPLTTVWRSAQVLAVRPTLGVKTVAEFVAYAKANPGKVTIGSAGVGAVTHLAIEVLKRESGVDVIHVPFRSTSENLPQVIGGQIDAIFGDGPTIAPQVNAGQIVALAVAGPKRALSLPNVPTMAEAGFPGVEAESWFGLAVSAKVPAPIINRLKDALAAAQKDPAYLEGLAKQGASAGDPGPEAYADLIRNDARKWGTIIKAAGITQ